MTIKRSHCQRSTKFDQNFIYNQRKMHKKVSISETLNELRFDYNYRSLCSNQSNCSA